MKRLNIDDLFEIFKPTRRTYLKLNTNLDDQIETTKNNCDIMFIIYFFGKKKLKSDTSLYIYSTSASATSADN